MTAHRHNKQIRMAAAHALSAEWADQSPHLARPVISSDITEVVPMPDVLIRNFPADDLELLDEQARRVGLSRTEYLRRQLQREARRTESRVTAGDLDAFSGLLPDLADTDVMGEAWS